MELGRVEEKVSVKQLLSVEDVPSACFVRYKGKINILLCGFWNIA